MPASACRRQPSARIARATSSSSSSPTRPAQWPSVARLSSRWGPMRGKPRIVERAMHRRYGRLRRPRRHSQGRISTSTDHTNSARSDDLCSSTVSADDRRDDGRPPLPAARRCPRGTDRRRHLSTGRAGAVGAPTAPAAPGQRHDGARGAAGARGPGPGPQPPPLRLLRRAGGEHAAGRSPSPARRRRGPGAWRAPLSVTLNLGIGNPQHPTLGAAVQGPELMPITALNRLMSQALRLQPIESHSYDAPPGSPAMRRAVARRAPEAGVDVTPDEVVVTSGAKEAVYLSLAAVTRPGRHGGDREPRLLRAARGAGVARSQGDRGAEPPARRARPRRPRPGARPARRRRRGDGVELLQPDRLVHDRRAQAGPRRPRPPPSGAAGRGRRVRRPGLRRHPAHGGQGLRP